MELWNTGSSSRERFFIRSRKTQDGEATLAATGRFRILSGCGATWPKRTVAATMHP